MIAIPMRPRLTTWAEAGVVPVNSINNVMVDGRSPIRITGDIPELLSRFPDIAIKHQKIALPYFHRYCAKEIVGAFDTDEHAQAGLEETERQLRLHPGPGIDRATPIGPTPEYGLIWIFRVDRLGSVFSHWDDQSRSIINETGEKHVYKSGFVIRQASLEGRQIFVITFGEGTSDGGDWYNPRWFKAWKNGNGGPAGFAECNDASRRKLIGMPGSAFLG